jgi:Protein of unknown function (DUF962)
MIDLPMAPDPLVQHWLKRHRSPISFIMHMIGIPPTILGVLLVSVYLTLLSIPIFLLALGMFVGGYVLQFAGHLLEGTDPGEIIYFKRRLGLPYVEFPPARQPKASVSSKIAAVGEPSGALAATTHEKAGPASVSARLASDGVSIGTRDELCTEIVSYTDRAPAVAGVPTVQG